MVGMDTYMTGSATGSSMTALSIRFNFCLMMGCVLKQMEVWREKGLDPGIMWENLFLYTLLTI